jgi:Zn-dependent protease with chaperone function
MAAIEPLSQSTAPGWSAQTVLLLAYFCAGGYALAFAAATLLVETLARPWRQIVGVHWTECARVGFAPGFALLWLAVALPPLFGFVGGMLEVVDPGFKGGGIGFWSMWLAAFAGIMTVRYRWLREYWGPRVTVRSWLAGCLVLMLLMWPTLLISGVLLFTLPEIPNARAAGMLGTGFLAMVFFVWGGGVLLLRLLGVLRPAPANVIALVGQLAANMQLPGRIRVYELEWAQVNALAWIMYRAVGFSRPLLQLMSPEEVRAVAAHELAHLKEPGWVRSIRVVHSFSYLAPVLVIKYGGPHGLLMGYGLVLAIMMAYRRFTRKLEQRADHLESEAIADPNAYMRSLVKLHEANLAPAVMPGAQTHPHLYDRLLAGGIQPDFPRPRAPSRSRPLMAVAAVAVVSLIFIGAMLIALGVLMRFRPASQLEDKAISFNLIR